MAEQLTSGTKRFRWVVIALLAIVISMGVISWIFEESTPSSSTSAPAVTTKPRF